MKIAEYIVKHEPGRLKIVDTDFAQHTNIKSVTFIGGQADDLYSKLTTSVIPDGEKSAYWFLYALCAMAVHSSTGGDIQLESGPVQRGYGRR